MVIYEDCTEVNEELNGLSRFKLTGDIYRIL